VEGSSGIYIGGIGGPSPPIGNTLIDNTARGSEYGIWIRNSYNNNVSESLAEDNHEGIAVEIVPTPTSPFSEGISTEAISPTGNTFTNDTSRNNDWDFVTETPSIGLTTTDTDIDLSTVPVRNLNIGASTKPGTTISFEANNVSLRSVRNPQSDPAGLSNIGRYFEANRTEGTTNPALSIAVSYEDADVSNVDESTLELLRFNETAGEWQPPQTTLTALDTKSNLVAGGFLNFSNFGVFGEGGKTCINRRNLGRGQEESECPFDRDIERGGTREGLDRDTGRGGGEEHRDSETARRNRGRGEGRSR
jgi:parallel beta-helix repeat protein